MGQRCSEKDLSKFMRSFLAAALLVPMRVECKISLVRRPMRSSKAALSCSLVSRAWCSSSRRSLKLRTYRRLDTVMVDIAAALRCAFGCPRKTEMQP